MSEEAKRYCEPVLPCQILDVEAQRRLAAGATIAYLSILGPPQKGAEIRGAVEDIKDHFLYALQGGQPDYEAIDELLSGLLDQL